MPCEKVGCVAYCPLDVHKDSAVLSRLEVVETGPRRRWTSAEKLRIVLDSMQAPRQVAATRHSRSL